MKVDLMPKEIHDLKVYLLEMRGQLSQMSEWVQYMRLRTGELLGRIERSDARAAEHMYEDLERAVCAVGHAAKSPAKKGASSSRGSARHHGAGAKAGRPASKPALKLPIVLTSVPEDMAADGDVAQAVRRRRSRARSPAPSQPAAP